MFGKKRKEREKGAREFLPSFDTIENFNNKYAHGDNLIAFGKNGDQNLCADVDGVVNKIVLVNDSDESVLNQCVRPMMAQNEMSYIVYDPDGVCYEKLVEEMRAIGYDVQLVDLADEDHHSRIDTFEVVNINKDPRCLSSILSSSIGCEFDEAEVADNLLMAMMHYELAERGMVNAVQLDSLFKSVYENDEQLIAKIEECQLARPHMLQVYEAKAEVREATFQKLAENLFSGLVAKAQNPNIFTITMHNKKSVMFVKRVPEQYRYLMTTMMFNLEASNAMCESDDVNVLLIDSMEDGWYDAELLEETLLELDEVAEHCYLTMEIRREIDTEKRYDDALLIYMHSDDVATNLFVYDNLKFKHYPREEHDELSKRFFKGKMIPDEVLERAPITMDEMKSIDGALVVDTTHDMKPMMFERLN